MYIYHLKHPPEQAEPPPLKVAMKHMFLKSQRHLVERCRKISHSLSTYDICVVGEALDILIADCDWLKGSVHMSTVFHTFVTICPVKSCVCSMTQQLQLAHDHQIQKFWFRYFQMNQTSSNLCNGEILNPILIPPSK